MKNSLDLSKKIINKEYGSYYIKLEDKEKLVKEIEECSNKNLWNKHEVSYSYIVNDDYICLVLHKTLKFGLDTD